MKIYIKNENEFKLFKKYETDAGFDIYCDNDYVLEPNGSVIFDTGIRIAKIENDDDNSNIVGIIKSRSGLSMKGIEACNGGVIDMNYRGVIKVKLYNFSKNVVSIKKGERVAQIIFFKIPKVEIVYTNIIEETDRNENGFGSTGIK